MFVDRVEAGRRLAQQLLKYRGEEPVVLALPRGGVVVAFEVALALGAPLDVIVARKLGAPGQRELAIGAVVDGEQPETVLNTPVIRALGVSDNYLRDEIDCQLAELARRQKIYRREGVGEKLADRTVIVIDDGVATGASVRAALRGVRKQGARKIVLAVPVAPPETLDSLRAEVDDAVCLLAPEELYAIGEFYQDFKQVSDEEVVRLLDLARANRSGPPESKSGDGA